MTMMQGVRYPKGTKMYQFQHKLKSLKNKIHTWNEEEFDNIFEDKKSLMEQLEEIQRVGMNEGYDEELRRMEKDT